MRVKTFRVSEINDYINKLLNMDIILNNLQVEGEISNFKLHYSGHMYFSLKDERSRIRCVMFKNNVQSLKFLPKNGMKVIIKGYISVYERDGQYQLYIQKMEPAGIGALYKAYEQLKEKLEKEGLFKKENKKSLPFFPRKIGIVTSPTGAAIRDIISVIARRNSNIEIVIYPALVQGVDAGKQIVNGIHYFNEKNKVDVIITARGGGSIEELWAFNEERVVRTIASSRIPIISAVGHETDFTIADFVADVRAATPSAAGELVVPSKIDLKYTLNSLQQRLIKAIENELKLNRKRIEGLKNDQIFMQPYNLLNQYKQQLDWLSSNLIKRIEQNFYTTKEKFQAVQKQFYATNPFSILNRGFAIIRDEKGNFLRTIDTLIEEENIQVILKDGILNCSVNAIKKGGLDIVYKKEKEF
ncbi:exodeoxyribonuclease VII large subunit [Garciella nitratireducens]|uniref:exodeoxyribonuclease VII large subunit n=1 Tax=Garciella nitratireducens TaxID=218205 RepID=UPI000DEAA5C0|nr:exodeoxyribonuclease VII large subunit [Garciella nitratireducens]RBP46655.1 exodeoxyribonuclease VII large subunit [Garciella nitratireducens]